MRPVKHADRDFSHEIEAHIRLEADQLIADGMSPAEAEAAARRSFGNVGISRERFYEFQRWMWWDELRRDLRYGLRSLAKVPSFTVTAALTIALGIGINTAMFSLMDAVLLRPLAVADPASLVFIGTTGSVGARGVPPASGIEELRGKTSSFTGMAAFATDELRIIIDGRSEPVNGQIASGDYFPMLGVKATLGRLLDSNDERRDVPVAVISDRYWKRKFSGDSTVLGKTVIVAGRSYTIAGVTGPGFAGMRPGFAVDITLPIARQIDSLGEVDVVARLKPGITRARAQAESSAVLTAILAESSVPRDVVEQRYKRTELRPAGRGTDDLRERFGKPLYALVGIAGLVLLLTTANIANLLLARGLARRQEFAARLAAGASRLRLIRQVITETLLLFSCGAIPGVLLARWGVTRITAMISEGRRATTVQADLDWRVMAFAIAVTLMAGLAAALFPAWRVFRSAIEQVIREGHTRSGESRSQSLLRQVLVASQVGISLVLLVSAITFAETLTKLRDLDPGFRNDQVLTMSVELPEASGRPAVGDKSGAVWQHIADAVRRIPGVKSAALATFTPLSQRDRTTPATVRGYVAATPADRNVHFDHVSEGYFETLGIPLRDGRLFTAQDTMSAPRVAVVNESTARKFFGGREPLGQTIGLAGAELRIVGVVRDTRHNSLREPPAPFVFIPLRQPLNDHNRLTLSVSSVVNGAEPSLLEPIRRRLTEVDPGLMIYEVISLRQQMDAVLLTERLLSGLAIAFGMLAMLLAAVGLYGVLSYGMAQQRPSIGIRMALGASPSSVARRVFQQSGIMIVAGVFCGLPFAVLAVRASVSLLWGVTPGNPVIYVLGAALLCLVGFISSWIPARRASGVEPAEILRHT